VLKDYSVAAAGLFNNMRTPAALVGAALVPLGILSAPKMKPSDTQASRFFKKVNILLAIASLLSEIIAITYSTIAINKIVELEAIPTKNVSQFIGTYHLLPWLGTNVHFLLGLFGLGFLAIAKSYFLYGSSVGNVAACWTSATMMFCASIVNKGISLGHGTIEDNGARFSNNLYFLVVKYAKLAWSFARQGNLSSAAVVVLCFSIVPLIKMLDVIFQEWIAKNETE